MMTLWTLLACTALAELWVPFLPESSLHAPSIPSSKTRTAMRCRSAGSTAIGCRFRINWSGVAIAWVLSIVGTLVLLKIVDMVIGLRVDPADEHEGLDLSQHGEEGYDWEIAAS